MYADASWNKFFISVIFERSVNVLVLKHKDDSSISNMGWEVLVVGTIGIEDRAVSRLVPKQRET